MRPFFYIVLVLSFFVSLLFQRLVYAYDQPIGLNLGLTSFLDGIPPEGPGLYFQEYIIYFGSDRLNDKDGHEMLSFADPDFDLWASVNQLLYISNLKLLQGNLGINLMIPFFDMKIDYNQKGIFPDDDGSGFGDLIVGPIIQWGPIVFGQKGPIFFHRIELDFFFPTGEYDDDKELNPGSNFFSFNPYWAATLLITPKLSITTRIHYLWNDKNNDPNRITMLQYGNPDDVQAGDVFHINFAASYEIIPKTLRIGLNGYYLRQISDSEVDNQDISGREEVLGIGPGLIYFFAGKNKDIFFFNTYFESEVENRPKGKRFVLR